MAEGHNPTRSPAFRLLTIAASGLGGFMLSMWGISFSIGGQIAGLPANVIVGMLAALCAMAAALAALSFFAGVDESVSFVYQETQIDKLTGVHARTAMVGKIAEAVAQTERTGTPVFLIDIDIDRFKQINDAIGYSQGDQLIRAIALRLRGLLPAEIDVGRIGASEFAVLIPDGTCNLPLTQLVEDLIERLMAPYQLPSHLQSVNLSVGIVAVPKDGDEPITLLRRSNLALQHARAGGIGNWAVFEPSMGQVADYRQWIEAELHVAFQRGDFHLHYQPQLDLLSGKIVGYEALVRWQHPERGTIPPAEFVPIAEETGMIGPIGEWVLYKACEDARLLPSDCFVAVNISPVQFMMKDFMALVRAVVSRTGIDPKRLELEVTETAMMQDRGRAAQILDELSAMGISVAVDDFGTGYSNLSYLIDFSFKKLKIDQSFVRRMETDANSGAVVSTIVGLSRALGVNTIAEGVETENQATLLKAAGCEVVQGFLYGKPAPLQPAGARRFGEPRRAASA
jgi:diguanylate cyclase (GGDEF)-like protein